MTQSLVDLPQARTATTTTVFALEGFIEATTASAVEIARRDPGFGRYCRYKDETTELFGEFRSATGLTIGLTKNDESSRNPAVVAM